MAETAYRPYAPLMVLKPFGDDIWIVDGPEIRMDWLFTSIPFPTRMTIVRLPDDGLWVHSPTVNDAALMDAVAALGPVRFLIAPLLAWRIVGKLEGRGLATQVRPPGTVVVALDGAGAALPLRAVAKLEPHGRGRPQAAAVQHDVDAVHVEEAVGLAPPRRRRRGFALLRLCHLWLCHLRHCVRVGSGSAAARIVVVRTLSDCFGHCARQACATLPDSLAGDAHGRR